MGLYNHAIGRQTRYKAYNLDQDLNKCMTTTMASTYERERSDSFCSKHFAASSNLPVTVFVSGMWEAFFIVLLLPWIFWMFNCTYPNSVMVMGWLFLVFLGILPAAMLRQGVTEGRLARVLDNQLGGDCVRPCFCSLRQSESDAFLGMHLASGLPVPGWERFLLRFCSPGFPSSLLWLCPWCWYRSSLLSRRRNSRSWCKVILSQRRL